MDNLNTNPFSELKNEPTYVSDKLTNKLRQMIIDGTFAENYMFPNENEMCKMLNIGRSSLREAYKVLESQGFIRRTKRGTFVNPSENFNSATVFEQEMSETDFNDLFELRLILETEAARLAAERADDSDIYKIEDYFKSMKKNVHNLETFSLYDAKYHLAVAAASHNKLLAGNMRMASDAFYKGVHSAFEKLDENGIERSLYYHEKILESVTNKDGIAASKYMKEHINNILSYISSNSNK